LWDCAAQASCSVEGETVNAALSDQVQLVIDAIPVVSPHARSRKLKALALAAGKRNAAIPEVLTTAEAGLPSVQIGACNCLVAPPRLPADKVAVPNAALAKVVARAEVAARLEEMSIETMPLGVEAYEAHVRAERTKWAQVVKAAGTRLA
jgi:tripartite-type tricarboxylate transporter receptor subunit TctC